MGHANDDLVGNTDDNVSLLICVAGCICRALCRFFIHAYICQMNERT